MQKTSHHTIRRTLFQWSLLLSGAILIIFGILFSSFLYHSEKSNAYAVLKEKNRALNYFVKGYFVKLYNDVEFLSQNKKIIHAPQLDNKDLQEVLALYHALEMADSDINYIYSGYQDGSLIINNYKPPEGFDSRVRPWYVAALKNNPEITKGIPYQDIKSRNWLVSISRVLLDEQKKVTGVLAIDCSLDTVERLITRPDTTYRSSKNFIVKPNGEVLICHQKKFLGRKISEIFDEPIVLNFTPGHFIHKVETATKLAYYSCIDRVGWTVITMIDKDEIIRPIIVNILISTGIIGFLAFTLGWITSTLFSRWLVAPLIQLKKDINRAISGSLDSDSDYKYPNNEIGIMASDIKKLTETELYNKNKELQLANQQLEQLSSTDRLTQLYNRRKIEEEFSREINRSRRYQHPFVIMLFDIDFFKKINDTYGHPAGDAVLKDIARLMQKTLRSTDIISRWGGEEFLVLLPELKLDDAIILAEKLRAIVANHRFSINSQVTISIGLYEFQETDSIDQMISKVDQKLYEAKKAGRNRIAY